MKPTLDWRGGARAEPRSTGVLPGLGSDYRAGSWPFARAAGRPGCNRGPSASIWGDPPWAVPAGTRSSRPGFLGDCCQVRNSKAEFIILADNWRCSSPELLPDRAPALCRAGPSSVGGASGSPRGKAVPGAQGLLGPWHRSLEGGTCFGAISACWSVAGKGRRRNRRDRGEAQMDVGWRAALPWLP